MSDCSGAALLCCCGIAGLRWVPVLSSWPLEENSTLQFRFIWSVPGRKVLLSIPLFSGVDFQIFFTFNDNGN